MNYTLSQIANITGGVLYGADLNVGSMSTDSRSPLVDGAMFVAIRGAARDGHSFVADMITRQCKAFMVEHLDQEWASIGVSFVVVADTLTALQTLAAVHRKMFKGTVVGLTGSNGKTIVKEWFADLWDSKNGTLFRSPRSYNSQLGVALSLLMIKGDEKIALIEAGISEPGEMKRLEKMINPDIVVLTNIGDAHGENFNSNDHKLSEKLILCSNCQRVIRGDLHPHDNISTHNLWIVEELYRQLGISAATDRTTHPIALRLEVQQGVSGSEIINDSYNSDLTSIAMALDFQHRTTALERRVLIVSDIEQSSLDGAELYGAVARLASQNGISKIIAVGDQIANNRKQFDGLGVDFYRSTQDFLASLNSADFAGASVLVKGARNFAFEQISRALELRTHTTTLEVNLSQLAENFKHYASMAAPHVRKMAMVKASSYGAGGVIVAKRLIEAGADYLAVAFADEGIVLRHGGITSPIIVLNSDPGSFAVMIENDLEPEIYSFESLAQYTAAARSQCVSGVPIHLKLDTGMHRLGFMPDQIEALCEEITSNDIVAIKSIFSHLAASEDPSEDRFTESQIALFERMSSAIINNLGLRGVLRSICNTAGTARFPDAHYDMVRIGIGLYENISTLKTRITQVKTLAAGQSVGYNRASWCTRETRIAIIPVGYADGMDRRLGRGVGFVRIAGVMCPTIGNICMDTTIVDVSQAGEVTAGDEAVIFSPEGPTVGDIARQIGTISYEILTSVSPRIKRLYIND